MGYNEWTITRRSDMSAAVFFLAAGGAVYSIDGLVYATYAVRPTFNLVPSVTYKSGIGTMSDPILIN